MGWPARSDRGHTTLTFHYRILARVYGDCQENSPMGHKTTPPVRIGLALILTAACATDPAPPRWEETIGSALCARAENLLEQGRVEQAKRAADEALSRSVRADHRARALHVLGLIDRSETKLAQALSLLETTGDRMRIWRTRLALADLARSTGEASAAIAHLERVLDETQAWADIFQRSRIEAEARHLLAAALRELGQAERARSEQRQALLALTLVDDDELPKLRIEATQALGDDHLHAGDPRAAFEAHARAATLARQLEAETEELAALRAMSHDLAAMGRPLDAATHAERALRLAQRLGERDQVAALARQALAWVARSGDRDAAAHRLVFVEALAELDAAGDGPERTGGGVPGSQ